MHLTSHEVERFYTIWFPLLHYVNQERKLVSSFPKVWRDAHVQPEVAVLLRDALWEDDDLRKAFIAENPAHLPHGDLALVESWQHHVSGNFFILRHLKKYSIFLSSGSPSCAYGVLGLTGPIEEIIGPELPVYVKTVLLPFEDRIIYDSLLSAYPIYFGAGYRSSFNDTYRDIQEREGVITRLPPHNGDRDPKRIKSSNKKVLAAFQKALGKSGLSPKMVHEHTNHLTEFANSFLLKKTSPRLLLDITPQDLEAYRVIRKGSVNLVSFKRFIWFLRDTGRMDWDEAEDWLEFLKRK
jgi:hypothetical protein